MPFADTERGLGGSAKLFRYATASLVLEAPLRTSCEEVAASVKLGAALIAWANSRCTIPYMVIDALEVQGKDGRVWLYQIGDLHADLKAFTQKELDNYIDAAIEKKLQGEAVVVFVMGDLIHGRLPGDKFFSAAILREDAVRHLDDYVNYMADDVTKRLRRLTAASIPTFITIGNHDLYLKNVDIAALVAKQTGAKYLSGEALVRLTVRDQFDKAKVIPIYVAHGSGGGSSAGGKLSKAVRSVDIADADIYLFGHIHDEIHRVIPIPYIQERGEAKLRFRDRLFSYASAFNFGRVEGVVDYAGYKSLPATSEGKYVFEIDTHEDKIYPSRVKV